LILDNILSMASWETKSSLVSCQVGLNVHWTNGRVLR